MIAAIPVFFPYGRKKRNGSALDFSGGVLPEGCTFTRASAGTYFDSSGVLQTALVDAPRFDYDPVTLGLRGLLIEPQRTNASPTSNQFGGVTANQAVSPDGTNNAAQGTSINDTLYMYPSPDASILSGETYASSLFLKAGTEHVAMIQMMTAFGAKPYVVVDLDNLIAYPDDGVTAFITDAGNGWRRCGIVATASSTGSFKPYNVFFTGNNVSVTSPPTTSAGLTLYLYGAQNEISSSATSYIQTSGEAATRAADQLSFTIPDGANTLRYTFDDDSTQDVSVSAGAYTVPTTLNRPHIKGIAFL